VSKTEHAFDVPAFINSRPIGAVQYGIVVLCGLVMFLDGLDTQAKFGPFPTVVRPLR
jgi:MFS transporter, AAHS family, 4-hydroxybenzoate transporter